MPVFVKICGITNDEDALLATALGADAIGFVFAPSPRQVDADTVRDALRRVPREIHTIGVFRDERPERVVEIAGRLGLHGVQLHGHEPDNEVAWIRDRVRFVIRAFAAGDPRLDRVNRDLADVVLVDAPTPGSGRVFDWRLVEGIPSAVRVLLAGGLTPANVGDAIRTARPWGVDVASGVEARPGRKDPRLLREFIEAAREAGDEIDAVEPSPAVSGADGDEVAGSTRPWDWEIDE